MTDDQNAAGKTPRKRSVKSRARTGCLTCKIRHVKCDEKKPTCDRCRQLDHKCEGYAYGFSSTNLPSSNRSLQTPPVPIPRVQNQPRTRVDVQPSPSPSTGRPPDRALSIRRAQGHLRLHGDDGNSPPAISYVSTKKYPEPSSTSISKEFKELAEQGDTGQNLEPRYLNTGSPISPRLSPTWDEYIEKTFRFTAQVSLPGLLLDHTSETDNPSCHAWIRITAENPAALQVRLYMAELYHRVLYKKPLNPNTNLLAIYAEAIKLLNEQMRDPATACSDGNLLAVGGLGFFGQSLPKFQSSSALPNQGPLQDLQRLHVYSQMVYDPMHRMGMDLMFKMRGGLEKFKTYGMAAVTSFGDIINATENLCPPRHIFVPMLETPTTPNILALGNPRPPSLQQLGTGFPKRWHTSNIPSLQNLFTVLQSMAAYTIIVCNHTQRIAVQENKGELADIRNFVQHYLLSLPPSEKLTTIPDPLYEATRLAALVYSLLIVFPVHGPRAPFAELASQLRFNLSFLDLDKQKETKLLLWILVMAAIAGINAANRVWFVWAVREFALRLGIKSWEGLKDILGGFLWLGITNDKDGQAVWQEVEDMKG